MAGTWERWITRRDVRAHVAPSTAARHRSAALATMPRCWRKSRALPTGARYRRYSIPCLSQTGRRLVAAAYSQNLHRSGALLAPLTAATGHERASFARRTHLSRGGGKQQPETSGAQRSAAAAGAAHTRARHRRLQRKAAPLMGVPSCRGQAGNPILALRGEGKNEDAKSRPGHAISFGFYRMPPVAEF